MQATVLAGLALALAIVGCRKSDDVADRVAADNRVETSQGELDAGSDPGAASSVNQDAPQSGSRPAQLFWRLPTQRTGIDCVTRIDVTHPKNYLYNSGFACGGVALGDVDADGRLDVFVVGNSGSNHLYRQRGELQFEDIARPAGVDGGDAWGAGAAMVDIDGDADLDIYLCNYDQPNQLFVNAGLHDGKVRFDERAADYGLDITDACLMPYFCDYDRDGDLDVYIVCYNLYPPDGYPAKSTDVFEYINGRPVFKGDFGRYFGFLPVSGGQVQISIRGRRDYLMRNNGPNAGGQVTFSEVTEGSGIYQPAYGLAAQWWDYDDDGDFDLYVANDVEDPDHLYRNNGDGTFTDVIQDVVPHTTYFSMGAAVGDVNNDGRTDCLVLDMAATTHFKSKVSMGEMRGIEKDVLANSNPRQVMRNAMFINAGNGRMLEAAHLANVAKSDWSWSPTLADFDNDGRLDAFITNGMTRLFTDSDRQIPPEAWIGKSEFEVHQAAPTNPEQNLAVVNRGELRFEDVSKRWGLNHVGMSFAAASGDLDNDGDLDLVVANLDEPVAVYRNESAAASGTTVRLRDDAGNRHGIGAVVWMETDASTQTRTILPQAGFASNHQASAHFGLGHSRRIESITVRWPDGYTERISDVPITNAIEIRRAQGTALPQENILADSPTAWFEPIALPQLALHVETPHDDFAYQPLLPNKYSQLGPGMACGDIDGDGDDDFYLGGAAGQPGRLVRNDEGKLVSLQALADLSFGEGDVEPFSVDARCEDMGCLLFDAEGDGDLDLYVVSGSYEHAENDPAQRDRLYLNNGKRQFLKAPDGALPVTGDCSGTICAADFDRDGDLDLFIGGRLIPRKYPLAPPSRLLVNESSAESGVRFVDRTDEVASDLLNAGMVTGACWSDVDDDGWIDLLLTTEWGPVRLLKNEEGILKDQTKFAGLSELLGWWNGIAGRDLDNDGDVDYVVCNFGWNTKYHASAKEPVVIYYGAFGEDQRRCLVEAAHEHDELLPIRGRSCSLSAMPHLSSKFPTYRAFASASLAEIYEKDCLQTADRWAVTELASGVLRNDGVGRFTFERLPRIAQVSPAFGIVVSEFNGDPYPDVYLVQNFFGPQIETGRHDGGLSQLLIGTSRGSLAPVAPHESGLSVPGDAKSLALSDFNGDGRPDVLVGINDARAQGFVNRTDAAVVPVRLRGRSGNPSAIGARVTFRTSDGAEQLAEVAAGGGYLSQSSATLYFGVAPDATPERISVRWPDGVLSQHAVAQGSPPWKEIFVDQAAPMSE